MEKVKLRIAELRRRKNITQQQLAEIVGVSFQTISKWETGSAMPDITYLPVLAEYFKVSIDQLMGIVPLSGEEYIARKTGTGGFWDDKMEYLFRTRKNYWNQDYIRFLIEQVWKIDKPVHVLVCGCGFGFLGMLMMPSLPKGSTYTGIDLAEKLLELGGRLFSETDHEACFIPASNEPSSRACTDIWRMPRGSNTPQLCCDASLMPRQLAAGYLTHKDVYNCHVREKHY